MPAICTSIDPDGQTVVLQSNMHDHKSFRCDNAFRSIASQEEVFTHSIKEHVNKMGQDLVVLAYGTTGSGKTYTMFNESGLKKKESSSSSQSPRAGGKSDGLAFQALRDLFVLKEHLVEQNITITLSFCQLYLEKFYDLFREGEPGNMGLDLREDASGAAFVAGLSEVGVETFEDACLWVETGLSSRIRRKTFLNMNSSRSHAILSVRVRRAQGRSTLVRFCDLAGSERLSRGASTKKSTMAESVNINKSISSLATVMTKLSDASGKKDARFVPFRDSKLTRLLAYSLKGGARVAVIATISPLKATYEGTVSTLKFALKAMTVVQLPPPQPRDITKSPPPPSTSTAEVRREKAAGSGKGGANPYILSGEEDESIRDPDGSVENSVVSRLSARRLKLPSRSLKEPVLLDAAEVNDYVTAAAGRHRMLSDRLEQVGEMRQLVNEQLAKLLSFGLDSPTPGEAP